MHNFFKRRIVDLDDKISKIFGYMNNDNHLDIICRKKDEEMFDTLIVRFLSISLMNDDEYNSFFGKHQDEFMKGLHEVINLRHNKWFRDYRKFYCRR